MSDYCEMCEGGTTAHPCKYCRADLELTSLRARLQEVEKELAAERASHEWIDRMGIDREAWDVAMHNLGEQRQRAEKAEAELTDARVRMFEAERQRDAALARAEALSRPDVAMWQDRLVECLASNLRIAGALCAAFNSGREHGVNLVALSELKPGRAQIRGFRELRDSGTLWHPGCRKPAPGWGEG